MISAASAQPSCGFTSLHWCLAPGFVQNLMHIVSLTCRAVLEKGQKCKKSIDLFSHKCNGWKLNKAYYTEWGESKYSSFNLPLPQNHCIVSVWHPLWDLLADFDVVIEQARGLTLSPSLQGCRYLRWAGRYNVSISPQLRCHTPKLGSPWQSRPTPMDSTRSTQEGEKREILRFCRNLNSRKIVGYFLLAT